MNHPMYFELQVADILRAKAFYEAAFGWEIVEQPGLPIPYYRIETEGIAGALLQPPVPRPQPGGTNAAVISMEVASFDTSAEKILAAGGIEAMAKFAIPGRCWQGYFQDTEGNTLGIFEPDENAA